MLLMITARYAYICQTTEKKTEEKFSAIGVNTLLTCERITAMSDSTDIFTPKFAQWIETPKAFVYCVCSNCHNGSYYEYNNKPGNCPHCNAIMTHTFTVDEYRKYTGYDLYTETTRSDGDMENE